MNFFRAKDIVSPPRSSRVRYVVVITIAMAIGRGDGSINIRGSSPYKNVFMIPREERWKNQKNQKKHHTNETTNASVVIVIVTPTYAARRQTAVGRLEKHKMNKNWKYFLKYLHDGFGWTRKSYEGRWAFRIVRFATVPVAS